MPRSISHTLPFLNAFMQTHVCRRSVPIIITNRPSFALSEGNVKQIAMIRYKR